MSLGGLFSSPSKQAQQSADATVNAIEPVVQQEQTYTDTHEQQLRDAIAGTGPNPYFAAGQAMDPAAYKVDPNSTTSFSTQGPTGTSVGLPTATKEPLHGGSYVAHPVQKAPTPPPPTQVPAPAPTQPVAPISKPPGMPIQQPPRIGVPQPIRMDAFNSPNRVA